MSPFRELFVEVAENLLLAAAEEARQRKAQQTLEPYQRPSVAQVLNEGHVASLLYEHFGWRSVGTWRSVRDRKTEFGVTMRCGHKHAFAIPDQFIEDSGTGHLLDLIEREWRRSLSKRKCYCVDPERP